MRSCSAASLEIPYAHLLTGDAMSLQPLKNQIPRTKFQEPDSPLAWNLVLGIWFLGCLFFGFATGRAWAGDPRRTPVVEAVDRVRAAVVNIHSERTVMGPASEELFSLSPSQNRINGM